MPRRAPAATPTHRVRVPSGCPVILVCAVLVVMVFAVYWQTREFAFVNFDDGLFVYRNEKVLKGLSFENIIWSFTAGIGGNSAGIDYWRPVSVMSHMLDVSLFGLNAGAHHLVSVALHALTAVILFLVIRGMTMTLWRSAFVAAVFAVHPLHVESVAWIAERKDVLSGLFFALTLGAYRRYAAQPFSWKSLLLVSLAGVFAMMSKPMLVTLPFVLLLLDVWPLNRIGRVSPKLLLVEKIPLFIMAAATAGFTLSMNRPANDVVWSAMPWYYCVGNASLSYAIYIKQTLWPTGLTCFYPFPGLRLAVGHVVVSLVVLGAISVLVWWRRDRRFLMVGWLWYLGMLVPIIGIVTQSGDQAHADRYTYLSMIGLTIMVAWPAAEWAHQRKGRRIILGWVAAALLLILGGMAYTQTSHWRNDLTLWTHAIECDANNSVAFANLGTVHVEGGRLDEAVACFRQAMVHSPEHYRFQARLNLGILLIRTGRLDEAEEQMRRALLDTSQATDAQVADAYSGLAAVLMRKGALEQAIGCLQKAADIRPNVDVYERLGRAQMQGRQASAAIDSFLLGLAINPSHIDLNILVAMAFASQGMQALAVEHYQKVLDADANHLPSLNNLAWLLATSHDPALRDGTKAVELMEKALQLPGGSRTHLLRTLAAASAEAGRYENATRIAQEAMDLAGPLGATVLTEQLRKEQSFYLLGKPWRE